MSTADLAACVMEVTGSTRQVALNLLAACANDVQAAVNLFLANEENEDIDVQSVADIVDTCPDEDHVRAPIAPIREQLIGPDDDNFRHASQASGAKSRSLPRIKVCPLRDFAREGSIMEESLVGSEATVFPTVTNDRPTRPSRSNRAQEMTRRARSSTTTSSSSSTSSVGRLGLGDLFRPPTDLAVAGTFQYIRTKATNMKRWLLVNVQSDNFNSQLLNRDVWSQIKVRELIKTNFLLWQVLSDTPEGARFATFYHCNETPYICIIDPRTGEELWKSEQPNKIDFLESLQVFLSEHASEGFFQSDSTKPGPSSLMESNTEESLTRTISVNHRKRTHSVEHATELSEEEQIMLAVRNSLKENGFGNCSSKKSKVSENEESVFHEISDSDDDFPNTPIKNNKESTEVTNEKEEIVPELHTAYLGILTDETTTLKIRLVNAGVDESATIKWPSDTKLRALQLYISEHFPMVKEKFKLISPFPRKIVDLEEENLMQTLKDANLHPSSTLHVHLDD